MSDLSAFNDSLPESRLPDSVDRQTAIPVALHLYDSAAKLWSPAPLEGGGAPSVPGAPSAASPPEFLDPFALRSGFTPAVDGTLLIQNLCRTCYYEGYVSGAGSWEEGSLPLYAAPSPYPMLSVEPESWACVPVRAGREIGFFMNGGGGPTHLEEISVTFLPGAATLSSGRMARHLDYDVANGYEAVVTTPTQLFCHPDANRAQVIVVSGTAMMGLGSTYNGATYGEGEGLSDLGPGQIAALRIAPAFGGQPVTIRVDYWRQA